MHGIEEILADTKRMKQNIELSVAKVELIIWHQDCVCEGIPQHYLKYKNLFVNSVLSEELTGVSFYPAEDDMLKVFAKIFAKWCGVVEKIGGTSALDKLDADVSEANKIFIKLVRLVNIFLKRRVNIKWSTKDIANNVLDHMLAYYKDDECHSRVTIEEDLLDCLMFNCLDGIVCQFEFEV